MSRNTTPLDVNLEIHSGEEGRLDRFLVSRFPNWSRTSLQRMINARYVLVDGHPVSPNHKLMPGQKLSIQWPRPSVKPRPAAGVEPPFPVLYEDDVLFVVNKPPGLVVHPAAGHQEGNTLVEMVAPWLSAGPWPEEMRPGLVHRLDRDTSGVIVLAKTPEAHAKVAAQFSRRQVKKTYLALVRGKVTPKEGTLESHLSRHPGQRQRFAIASDSGRWAVTKFVVRERIGEAATLLELHPLTGRTHQIRVHLAAFKHPILGDHVYGLKEKEFSFVKRHMLHASSLQILHPLTGGPLVFQAPLPDDFQESLKLIRLNHV